MFVPLMILGVGAILAGVLFKELFFGHEYAEFWKGALFTSAANEILEEYHHVPLWIKLSPFIAMVLGFIVAWIFYIRSPETPKALAARHRGLYQFLLNKWYFDELYDFIFVRPARWIGRLFWKGAMDGSLTASARMASRPACLTLPTASSRCSPVTFIITHSRC